MTIYLVKWNEALNEGDVMKPNKFATPSFKGATDKYKALSKIKDGSINLAPMDEAIVKLTPKSQVDVINLINTL